MEEPAWTSVVDSLAKNFYLLVKPIKILDKAFSYEEVTEGFAHELSEGYVTIHQKNLWANFQPKQVEIFRSFGFVHLEKILMFISYAVRGEIG